MITETGANLASSEEDTNGDEPRSFLAQFTRAFPEDGNTAGRRNGRSITRIQGSSDVD